MNPVDKQPKKETNNNRPAKKAHFLAHNGKDKVRMGGGQIFQFQFTVA